MDNIKMKKIAFITGITGQDGSYLAELLLKKKYTVYGLIRRNSANLSPRIDHLRDQLHLMYGDITDQTSILHVLNEIAKDSLDGQVEVYNLAAQSHVKISFEVPVYTLSSDGMGTLVLLEACRLCNIQSDRLRIYQASTSELYGDVLEIPQTEKTPFNPQSPYAVAKLYAHWISKNYREAYGMFISTGILFNHESPRRGLNFVTRKITRVVAETKNALDKNLRMPVCVLGNLDSKRDWGHAIDYVEGMWRILNHDTPDDFVLATGNQFSVREFVEKAYKIIGIHIVWKGSGLQETGVCLDTGVCLVKVDCKFYRPTEVSTLLGDPSKANSTLGWKATVPFQALVKEMVEHDISEIQNKYPQD